MLSAKRAATLSLRAPPDVVARAASSHCRSRLGRDAAVSVRVARLGAACLHYLAVPRFVGRTRRECLVARHSLRPEHLGRSVRTSDTGDLVFRIHRIRTSLLAYVGFSYWTFRERSVRHEPPSASSLPMRSFALRTVLAPSAATSPGSSVGTMPTTEENPNEASPCPL
jgi:hypothetical protein